ncbi:phage tail-collar fiber domain-containing protein [Vibrio cholerae]|uniref:phage tail-collar fiber domain-containing protein n=1 Tax=Vibrio cholerae TaxID=666 RepID=UPI000662DACC|nr:phage tail protein [Vibrio cholerae]CSA93346.1 putative tail fiber protein [Vibrio cholerae]
MSQTAIPLQFEKYLQNQISVGKAPDMNEMIFAYIPNLDPSQPIDRNQGLPAVSTWVYQQDIDQEGKLGDNALVYSVVIPGSVAAFTFNAIYLRDKNVPNSCGIVVHKATETKEAGMASTKSLMQQYTGAAQIAGITVDAQTWQIDYQARLLGIEDDMRLVNLDNYGHTAFIQGFDVTQQADPAKYKVAPGVVYVGGLRAELKNEVIQTISDKPTGLYIDVARTGTVLSKWQNIVTIRASETQLTDYIDQNQQQHYVARLAGINANGSITDWRVKTDNADQEWSPFINYGIGHEVVRNGLRYIARLASGPDNGGAITPSASITNIEIWDMVIPQSFAINLVAWVKIASISKTLREPVYLTISGGSPDNSALLFVADIVFGVNSIGIPSASIGAKYQTLTDPKFYIRDDDDEDSFSLWVNRQTPGQTQYTITMRSRPRFSQTLVGVLEKAATQPSFTTLVPYDTGYQFAAIPIGMEVAFDTPPPTNDPRFRFVKLTYNDAYNTGLLTSQTLSGSAPELVSTAVISAAKSPINGQTIYLKNTMGVYAVPATTEGIIAQNIPQPARYRIDSISHGVSLQTGPSISGFIITSAASESQITGGLKPRSFGEVLYKRIY